MASTIDDNPEDQTGSADGPMHAEATAKLDEDKVEASTSPTRTFSLRLTQEQADLVAKAAELRGWTSTNLIRVAALEKAAYVVNTSTANRFDFTGLAATVGQALFGSKTFYVADEPPYDDDESEPAWRKWHPDEDEAWDIKCEPESLGSRDLSELQKAARLGGGEFLTLILRAGEILTSKGKAELPEPVDPTDF